MDTLLILVTGLSLAMAIAMGGLVLTLLREDRRRSDARVAALLDMAGEGPRVTERMATEPVIVAPAVRAVRRERPVTHVERPVAHDIDLDLRSDASPTAGVGNLFSEPEQRSTWRTRMAVAAGLAVMVAGAGYALLSSSPSSAPAAAAQGTDIQNPAPAPLELLSLHHTQENSGLAVTGLVQNPRSGRTLTRVIATVTAFSAGGTVLASGRAPLDFTTLAPGAESPFVVHTPLTGAVARYRIGFRAEDGDVIAHVDKRGTPDAVARK